MCMSSVAHAAAAATTNGSMASCATFSADPNAAASTCASCAACTAKTATANNWADANRWTVRIFPAQATYLQLKGWQLFDLHARTFSSPYTCLST